MRVFMKTWSGNGISSSFRLQGVWWEEGSKEEEEETDEQDWKKERMKKDKG